MDAEVAVHVVGHRRAKVAICFAHLQMRRIVAVDGDDRGLGVGLILLRGRGAATACTGSLSRFQSRYTGRR
jgi:hypothetical protein